MADGSSSAAANIPIRATYPRQLIVYDSITGSWDPIIDSTEESRKKLITLEYLAVSYRQSDYPDKVELEKDVQRACEVRGLNAYWLDFACTGKTQEEKNQDLYRIADVFRSAKATLIMIPDTSGSGWKSWGGRVWTYPEALLSETHICKEGPRFVRAIKLAEIHNLAYANSEVEHRLAALYGTGGRDFGRFRERFRDLCHAIWTRNSGPGDSPSMVFSSLLTALPGERVYALMGFMQYRIIPDPAETEGQAFDRLMKVNGLECNFYPWDALGTGSEFVVRDIMTKTNNITVTSEKSDADAVVDIPYVPAAKYNDSHCAVKNVCEEGTRVATLASIYEWLEQGSSSAEDIGSRVFWIYGLAGSGKSTIAKTVAEYCDRKNILGATFFCSRFNNECSNKFNIFTTISYQLCQRYDAFKGAVLEELKKDRDLGRADLFTQLEKLIIIPLRAVKQMTQSIIIIDALDECSDDSPISDLLEALNRRVSDLNPLKFIISSRPEDNIRSGFRMLDLNAHLNRRNLGEISLSEANDDIRKYLKANLQITKELSLTDDDIEAIVQRSQGLFIFASTTIRFLEDKKFSDPAGQLRRLLASTSPSSDASPYAHLDKLYMTIMEKKFNGSDKLLLAKVQTALSILIAARVPLTISALEGFMPGIDIRAIFQDLHSLIFIPDREKGSGVNTAIRFIHPSFRDFLVDKKRCTSRFVINLPNNVLTRCCAKRLLQFADSEEPEDDIVWVISDYGTEIYIPSLEVAPEEIQTGSNISLKYASDHFGNHLNRFGKENFSRIRGPLIALVATNLLLGVKTENRKHARHPVSTVIKLVLSEIQAPVYVKVAKTWPNQPLIRSKKRREDSIPVSPTEIAVHNSSTGGSAFSRKPKRYLVLVRQNGFKPDNFYFSEEEDHTDQ